MSYEIISSNTVHTTAEQPSSPPERNTRKKMGKYMKKPKTTRRSGEMEVVSQSTLGVRTRARTLALQQQRSSAAAASYSPSKPDYLELRSRRLQKPPLVVNYSLRKSPPSTSPPAPVSLSSKLEQEQEQEHEQDRQQGCFVQENPQIGTTAPIAKQDHDDDDDDGVVHEKKNKRQQSLGFGIHPQSSEIEPSPSSFGDNYFDTAETRGVGGGRTTRESTPCSLIRTSDTITTPGSSTKQRTSPANSNQRAGNALLRDIPTAHETEEFFAQAEQPQQRRFIEKYNFDIVNDVPLPGRYEWVKVMP